MRVYIPAGAGLGAPEIYALRRLSRPSLAIIADELTEPGSHEAIRWILQQRDPEQALAQTIAENIHHTTMALLRNPNAGMGDLLGKSFWKKLVKVVRKVTITFPKKVMSTIAKYDPIYRALKPTLKKVMRVVRKVAPILITAAGAVLSVVFPPLSPVLMLSASLLTTAYKLRAMKIDADKAKRAGKAEANLMQTQVYQQTAQVNAQADQVYAQEAASFQAAGWDQASWNALTLDQKVAVIEGIQNGQIPVNPAQQAALLAAQQAAQQQVASAAAQAAASAAAQAAQTPPAYTQSSGAAPSGPVNYVQQPPPPSGMPDTSGAAPDSSSGPFQNVIPSSTSTSAAAPSPYTTGTDETTGLPTAGGYTVTVEGQTITNYPITDPSNLSAIIASGTQPGDRFEILADGTPTGLRVRTQSGFISIPDSMRSQVMAMPHDQVLALLTQAVSNVAAQGGPVGPAPVPAPVPSGGGMPAWGWLALAGGAAAALSTTRRR